MRKNLITRQCGDLIHSVHLRFQRSNIQKFYQNSKCIPAWTVEKDSKRWSRQVVPSKKNRASIAKKEKRNRTVLRTPPISLANTSIASSVGTKFDKHHSARNEPRKIEKRCNHFPFEMGWKYVKALFEPTLENWRWNLAKQRTESKRKIEFLHLARTQKKVKSRFLLRFPDPIGCGAPFGSGPFLQRSQRGWTIDGIHFRTNGVFPELDDRIIKAFLCVRSLCDGSKHSSTLQQCNRKMALCGGTKKRASRLVLW